MKRTIVVFLAGLIVGAALSWGGAMLRSRWLFGHLIGVQVAGQVHVLQEIRRGRGAELADGIEQTLPEYVQQLDSEFPSTSGGRMALEMVSSYYRDAGATVPEQIRGILSSFDSASSH